MEKKQKFIVYIDKAVPSRFFGDEQRLAQVITNLLYNAIKFTPDGGDIALNVDLVENINGFCRLKISVSDSGIGLSTEQQSKLFQSFQQADSSTT